MTPRSGFLAFIAATLLLALGCSYSVGLGSDPEPSYEPAPAPAPARGVSMRSAAPPRSDQGRFLGHLAVKGVVNDNRNLMTSIVVHPRLWNATPYVLIDQNAFDDFPKNEGPMNIDLDAIRAEAQRNAEIASIFWGARPVNLMVNTEGWPLQWDVAYKGMRQGAGRDAYNRQATGVYLAIREGLERGWPSANGIGWWSRLVTPEIVRRQKIAKSADDLNLEASEVWRRVDYLAGHIYPFTRLVPDDRPLGEDEAHEADWRTDVSEAVTAMLRLRSALGGDQEVLPCMFATRLGWRGRYKDQLMTETERRLLVRSSFEAGADGILVWQPIRSETERDEFQEAIRQIEAELAEINGIRDLGPAQTLGELFRIKRDWPAVPKDWMRRVGDQTLGAGPGTR